MRKALFRLSEDFGRHGSIDCVFIGQESLYEEVKRNTINIGSALGKHSDVDVEGSDIKLVSRSTDLIHKLEKIFGNTIAGYHLFDCYEDQKADGCYDD